MDGELKALEALRLHENYMATPQDRGGPTGPKGRALQAWLDAKNAALRTPAIQGEAQPVAVTIFCPECAAPHLDEGEWATRPHKTHQCQGCGHEWRPFPFATVGIAHPATEQAGEVERPHCQLCGGVIEGWVCQTCEADFEEVGGLLILKSDNAPQALADMKADAERYRFLRSRDPGPDGELPPHGPFIGVVPDNLIVTEHDADHAVDRARLSNPGAKDV